MKKPIILRPYFFVIILSYLLGCSTSGIKEQKEAGLPNYYDSTFVFNGDTYHIPRFDKGHRYIQVNDIPPRFQWNGNNGYCGEVSMISAGLYYGQYISQYDVRQISYEVDNCQGEEFTCGKIPGCENNQGDEFLLDGGQTSDKGMAHRLKLGCEFFGDSDSEKFIKWVKKHVAEGHPVMIGVMNNVIALGEDTVSTYWTPQQLRDSLSNWGEDDYDHIVPVIGFASEHPLLNERKEAEYYSTDIILFSDNGIYTPGNGCDTIQCLPKPASCVPYYTEAKLDTFFKTRYQANTSGIYALPRLNSGQDTNLYYGIAVRGIMVNEGYKPIPVRIRTDVNYEATCNDDGSYKDSINNCCIYQPPAFGQGTINRQPAPNSITLNITVSGLEQDRKYKLYRYNNENCVPEKFSDKNIGSPDTTYTFKTAGTTYTMQPIEILSDKKAFFRAAKVE